MYKPAFLASSLLFGSTYGAVSCKTTPFDPTWPSTEQWNALNQSVGGELIKTRPVASSCLDDNPFGSTVSCDTVQENWFHSAFHARLPESIDYSYWANSSCVPPNDYAYSEQTCEIGGLPQYILNASTAETIATTTAWASSRNIRLVIKGTGHDLNGRSSGAYALSIWTHQLKENEFDAQWARPLGNGTEHAAIIGSGSNWGEVLQAAAAIGRTVVSGQDSTVGLGGFIGGGGHGPLSSHYGLAADQVLQATVVTTEGQVLVANEAQNQDLLWAIRGGGPGVFGVVTEYVLRTYPVPRNVVMSTLSISILDNSTEAANASWDALALFYRSLPDLMDLGMTGNGRATTVNMPRSGAAFERGVELSMTFFAFNITATAFKSLLEPLNQEILSDGRNQSLSVQLSDPTTFSSYMSFFAGLNSSPSRGGDISLVSSRLLGRRELSLIEFPSLRSYLQRITWSQVEGRTSMLVFGLQGGLGPKGVEPAMRGALNPAWREAYVHLISTGANINTTDSAPHDALAAAATWVEENKEAVWREWAPKSGSYINEANPFNGNFQYDYFGGNYDRLVSIKEKYDPTASLFALSGVGSHLWDYNLNSGKLCRK
ncbi:FAD-dependent monooxygenase [Ilyonectria sp. MPI-CAGE-AT-0026]|nr:FAD-dependent monooxygenase [Ilyonectria sp. MPI-CAGE-AT-0026]